MSYSFDQTWARPFAPSSTEPSVMSTSQISVKPRENVDNSSSTYSFDLPSLGEYFPNLASLKLYVRGKVVEDGKIVAKGTKVALCNNAIHVLFSSITCTLGENQCQLNYNNYPYLAYLQTLDKMSNNDITSRLSGFFPDAGIKVAGESFNFKIRQEIADGSKVIEMMSNPWCDILNIDSYLLKNTPLSIQLHRSDAKFYIEAADASKKYTFNIEKIRLYLDTILPNPSLTQAIEHRLMKTPAKYHFDHLSIKKFSIPRNMHSYSISRAWTGELPRRFALAWIPQKCYMGEMLLDPLKMEIDNIKSVILKVNERDLMKMDPADSMIPSYERMIQFLQVGHHSVVSIDVYKTSAGFLCADLNSLCQNDSSCITEVHPSGTLSIELEFSEETDDAMLLFLFSYTPGTLTVNKERDVIIDTGMI